MTNIGYIMKKGLRHRFRKRLKKMTSCRDAECILAVFPTTKTDNQTTKTDHQATFIGKNVYRKSTETSGSECRLLLERLSVPIFIPLAIITFQLL